jgi:hypothetical protein
VAEVPGLEMSRRIPGMSETAGALPIADDVTVAAALVDGESAVPGVTVRQFGRGRVVWITGWSHDYSFSRLVRSAVQWASGYDPTAMPLDVTGGEDLFVYAYPGRDIVALLSTADEPAEAVVRCHPRVLGVEGDARVADIVTDETLGTAAELADGLTVTAIPNCVRLLRVR